jgi:hypothetical protein
MTTMESAEVCCGMYTPSTLLAKQSPADATATL